MRSYNEISPVTKGYLNDYHGNIFKKTKIKK